MIIATVAADAVAVTRLETLSEEVTVTMIGTGDAVVKGKNAEKDAEEIVTAMMIGTVIAIEIAINLCMISGSVHLCTGPLLLFENVKRYTER